MRIEISNTRRARAPFDSFCTRVKCILLAAAFVFPASLAAAIPSTDFTFFGPGSISLEFNEIPMAQSTVITTQYATTGVTFSPNVWFENHRAAVGWDNHNIANFLTGTSTVNPSIDMVFSTTVDGAAFEFAANGGNAFLFEAVLGGTTIETFVHTQVGCCAAQILGFEATSFDTLRVTHQSGGSAFFLADQLTWHPIPEPSIALLLGLGLATMPAGARRRRSDDES